MSAHQPHANVNEDVVFVNVPEDPPDPQTWEHFDDAVHQIYESLEGGAFDYPDEAASDFATRTPEERLDHLHRLHEAITGLTRLYNTLNGYHHVVTEDERDEADDGDDLP